MKLNQGFLRPAIWVALLILLIWLATSSQTKKITQPIIGGVVNGKALTLPKPEYPEEARKTKLSGVVMVEVLIDEAGKVVSAKTISGLENTTFRIAAEAAAMKATFSPTTLKEQPVKVSGVINYNFTFEKNNEERLRVMSVATFLTTLRMFASDVNKFKEALDEKELLKDDLADFGEYAPILKSLESLEKLPVDKRLEAIDYASSLVRAKLTDRDRWQFEVGKNLGETLGPLMLFIASARSSDDLRKLDGAAMKLGLNKIRNLTLSAPPDFPPDVLAKLKVFAAVGAKDNLATPENLKDLVEKMGELFDAISSGSTK